jgi:hypothetical protein
MVPALLLIALTLSTQTATPDFDPRAGLAGLWTADKLSMIEAMPEYQRIQQEVARKAFKDAFVSSFPDTTFDFGETSFTLTLGTDVTVVNYRIVKVEGSRMLIRTMEDKGGVVDEQDVEAEYVTRDTLTLFKKGDPFTFRLKRVKPAPRLV